MDVAPRAIKPGTAFAREDDSRWHNCVSNKTTDWDLGYGRRLTEPDRQKWPHRNCVCQLRNLVSSAALLDLPSLALTEPWQARLQNPETKG